MGTEENKRLVRRFYEEVVKTGDVENIVALVSEDCVEADGPAAGV